MHLQLDKLTLKCSLYGLRHIFPFFSFFEINCIDRKGICFLVDFLGKVLGYFGTLKNSLGNLETLIISLRNCILA